MKRVGGASAAAISLFPLLDIFRKEGVWSPWRCLLSGKSPTFSLSETSEKIAGQREVG